MIELKVLGEGARAARGWPCSFAYAFAQQFIRIRRVFVNHTVDSDYRDAPADTSGGSVLWDTDCVVACDEFAHLTIGIVLTRLE